MSSHILISHRKVTWIVVVFAALLVMATVSYAQGRFNNGRNGMNANNPAQQNAPYGNGYGNGPQNDAPNGYGIGFGYANRQNMQAGNCPMGTCAGQMGLGLGLPAAVAGQVPAEVIDAMNAGILDEYNAYNAYQAVIDQFGAVAPFVNIQAAEAQHIAAWEFIFDRYDVELPEVPTPDAAPEFASFTDACQTAAQAEVNNMNLYDEWLVTVSDYPDITQVVTNLRDASEFNHLPAFERCAG